VVTMDCRAGALLPVPSCLTANLQYLQRTHPTRARPAAACCPCLAACPPCQRHTRYPTLPLHLAVAILYYYRPSTMVVCANILDVRDLTAISAGRRATNSLPRYRWREGHTHAPLPFSI